MGVPKFFRWVAERYPTVITPFKDSPPPIDNLYLDMNGIIHNCTHTNDFDASKKAPSEKEMVQAIFAYLEKIFQSIQPRKHFVLAVDGCAPRAKMNQQRQRRYRSGYEMMVAREEAAKRGEDLPDEGDVFDSNCITPGTEFMVRLSEHFKYFISMKLTTDTAWQNCKVIFSGHDHPGEGEHKIVDFIRRRKMQPGYDPNETHCMYGLDADLVMLALATHEPRFVLLREVVSFGASGTKKERERKEEDEAKGIKEDSSLVKAEEFVLFHINVLREFLDLDIRERLGNNLDLDKYDLERVLDDFVFMCFFIGNDFLPSIPTIGINDGGMLTMLNLYVENILSKGTYLTRDCQANWNAVEVFLSKIGELELDTIRARQEDEADHAKRRRRHDDHEVQTSIIPVTSIAEYKQRYYSEKLKFEGGWQPRSADMEALRLHYIEGIMWVFQYYYQGPASWKWFYPHHYAPLASDLVNLSSIASKVRFDKGEPFLPHQQLLAVLPPMSYRSLPKAYWPLLRSKSSPLHKFFPEHLEIDKEGAHSPWEGIVLIPFIDEKVLLLAYESVQRDVGPEDNAKNVNTASTLFTLNKALTPYTLANSLFRPLTNVQVERVQYEFPASAPFRARLLPGARINDKEVEGFSSLHSKMKYLAPTYEIGTVTIFGPPTRKESMILQLLEPTDRMQTVDDAFTLIGQEVLVGYPHYKRARIAAVSDRRKIISAEWNNDGQVSGTVTKELSGEEIMNFKKECETHIQFMKCKLGIALPEITLLVYVHRFVGMKLTRKGRVARQFAKSETCYPIQLTCRLDKIDLLEDPRYMERDRGESDCNAGSKVIYMGPEPKANPTGNAVFGSVGFVTETPQKDDDYFNVALRVFQTRPSIPQSLIDYATTNNWRSLNEVAHHVDVKPLALSMLCSSIITSPHSGSQEIGLCMKFTGKNLARIGYAKLVAQSFNPWYVGASNIFEKMEDDRNMLGHHLEKAGKGEFLGRSSANKTAKGVWYFSERAVQLIEEYVHRFEPLVRRLETGAANATNLDPSSMMTGPWQNKDVDDVLGEITSFLEGCGIMDTPMINATEDSFTREQLVELEDHLDKTTPRPQKEFLIRNVLRRNLYFPTIRTYSGYTMSVPLPRDQKYQIGARVVYCRTTGSVPFGATGTIVRLLATGQEAEVVYDEPFTGGLMLGGRLRTPRGALTKLGALLVVAQLGSSNFSDRLDSSSQPQTNQKPTSAVAMVERTPTAGSPDPRTTSPPIAKLTSDGTGGIRLADLQGKVPVSPTPAVDARSFPRAQQDASPPQPPKSAIPAPRSAGVATPQSEARQAPTVANMPAAVKKSVASNVIAPEFANGQVVIRPHDVPRTFETLLAHYLKEQLSTLQ